ncbi:MAG: methyltransferase domain-containing protein [Deltaproteobacteria bacterium]|nr:methyltransferase domain-containing protein [Deltaproteobacteria bacterium]
MPDAPRPDSFRRLDESEDELFYRNPRFLVHIDDGAIAKVREIYASILPVDATILDLMSSWRSHIPESIHPAKVVGLGLNQAEMADNPALNQVVVHNVNMNPRLPFGDETFDGVVMTVSVQYLTRPIELFADVGRVLKPGAPFIVTFSNRMFPTKAVALWHGADRHQRVTVVQGYFAQSAAFEKIQFIDASAPTDPHSDPIWAVAGFKSVATG